MLRSANAGRGYESPMMDTGRDPEQVRGVLGPWLSEKLAQTNVRIGAVKPPTTSGVANETLLVDAEWEHYGQTEHRSFVVRIEPARQLFPNRKFHHQFLMHEALASEPGVPVPPTLGYEENSQLLGGAFFVSERIPGLIPGDRPHFTETGFVAEASPTQRQRLFESGLDTLARLHQVPADRFPFLTADSSPSGLEVELGYWRRYTDELDIGPSWNSEVLEYGWTWLVNNLPSPPPTALSWGDSRIGNMIFRDYEVVALLDWDTVSLAGPEADLAWWIQMDRHSWELLPGLGTPDDLVERWQSVTGRSVRHLHWNLVFTAFRLGVIRMKLRRMMVADGILPAAEAAPNARNESIQLLGLWLDIEPPGEVDVRKPRLRRL